MHSFVSNNKFEKSNVVDLLTMNQNVNKILLTEKKSSETITTSNDTKSRIIITSERLQQLKKIVEDGIREHKTFTIKGGWQTLRNQLYNRGWIEKYEYSPKKSDKPNEKSKRDTSSSDDDVCSNLPEKQEWESPAAYTLKCEKTIMSRMLQNHAVDFFWSSRREASDWHHRIVTHQIMNRFYRSLFTSKEGLNLLLQHCHWYCEPGIADVNFPRCYTLGFPGHYTSFIDDFRLTACICLLKWITRKYELEDEYVIKSPEGKVSHKALDFALARCNEYLACEKHLDIDRDFDKVWNHEWDEFLTQYYQIMHEDQLFIDTKEWSLPLMNASAKTCLNEIRKYWPNLDTDSVKNIWILKPGNKCRGRGIQLIKCLKDVEKVVQLKLKYVVQKYIEMPLLIYQTKFDIRQWFMVTSVQPLNIWMYKESYLRFSSQIFTLDNFHESLHLTNHAVQCKYNNGPLRNKALPANNMWDCQTFKKYLVEIGQGNAWDEIIYPGMKQNIVGAMIACQDTMDRRINTFELYGADFILSENFTPWLLEINSSPDFSSSTSVTSRMCPQCLQDLIKVVIDWRRNSSADTGKFELIYRQHLPRPPAYLGMNLSVRGRRIFKNKRSRGKEQKDKENKDAQNFEKTVEVLALEGPYDALTTAEFDKNHYKGPIINDFMDEINMCTRPESKGYEFVPSIKRPPTATPKKKHTDKKNRVLLPKTLHNALKSTTDINQNHFANRKRNERRSSFGDFGCPRAHLGTADIAKTTVTTITTPSVLKSKVSKVNFESRPCLNSISSTSILSNGFTNAYSYIRKPYVQNKSANMLFNKRSFGIPFSVSSINLGLSIPAGNDGNQTDTAGSFALENLSDKN